MKHAKRFVSLLLALVMVLSFSSFAFAAEGDPATEPTSAAGGTTPDPATPEQGSVTINGALKGNTFTLYKVFDLYSYDAENNKYSYTIRNDSPLYDTIKNMTLKAGNPASDQLVFDLTSKDEENDYVQLRVAFQNIQDGGTEIKTIADTLMKAIEEMSEADRNKILVKQVDRLGDASQTTIPDDGAGITTEALTGEDNKDKYNITFSDLALGYYLVDSSAGAMVGLTTTNPDATIDAKNELPNVQKEVKKNVNNQWDEANTKIIGETVNYRVQVVVKPGATNYVIYDSMSEGLTFDKITKVYYGYNSETPPEGNIIYDASKGTAITDSSLADYFTYTEATEAASITHNGEDCCFSMKFTDSFLNQVLKGQAAPTGYVTTIFVEYDAVLNEKAVIGEAGNPNDIYMTYGDNNVDVAHDTVTTKTYEMELVKHNDSKEILQGAEFEVYTVKTETKTASTAVSSTETLSGQLYFIKTTSEKHPGKTVYRVATQDQINDPAIATTPTIVAGDVIIEGLGGNFETSTGELPGRSYYFKETKAPEGYNLIPSSTEVRIINTNKPATFEVGGKYIDGGLGVLNRSGSILPSTGGIGTTIFYVVGSILLVGSAVLLITRRRMRAEK